MKKRLIQFLNHLEIGQDKFAKNVGLSRGYVNNIKDNMTLKSVNKIVQVYPELNEKWLLTGEGKMLKENNISAPKPETNKMDNPNQILSERLEQNISEFIAIEKENVEINKMNAESFGKVADCHVSLTNSHGTLINSHDTLINNQGNLINTHDVFIKSHDKLIDLFKEYLSEKKK